ncbi:MAG: transposase family protein [Paludibacteraceae bacterium]
MEYKRIKRNPSQFSELLLGFETQWENYISHYTLEGKVRYRAPKQQVCPTLPTSEEKLFFILMYLKTNPLQEQLAASFSLTQPKSNILIQLLSGILHKSLRQLGELPERNAQKLKYLTQNCQDLLLDGVERSPSSDRQKECYSGKKNS